MKYQDNIKAVAALQPDYLGFIFYEKSARFFNGVIPELAKNIKKTGVFVDASTEYIIENINKYDLLRAPEGMVNSLERQNDTDTADGHVIV